MIKQSNTKSQNRKRKTKDPVNVKELHGTCYNSKREKKTDANASANCHLLRDFAAFARHSALPCSGCGGAWLSLEDFPELETFIGGCGTKELAWFLGLKED